MVVVVVVSDVSDVSESAVVDEELPPLSVPQDIIVKLISKTTKNSIIVFIMSPLQIKR